MAGISSKVAGKLENKQKWNVGSELNTDFEINLYETFYRNVDPQIGRFWQIDPETDSQESLSPYHSMDNNPISNVDPLGDFASRVGALWNRLWHGGGTIEQNKYGEWSVNRTKTESSENGGVTVTSYKYYGEGRNKYTATAEAMANDYKIQADIQLNGERSLYTNYNSQGEAGMAALSIGSGVLLPTSGYQGFSTISSLIKASKINKLMKAGRALSKGGLSAVGRALQKHGDRIGSLFPKISGNALAVNEQAEKILYEIVTNPTVETTLRNHARFGEIMEYKLPNGQGARFSSDLKTFFGFIEN